MKPRVGVYLSERTAERLSEAAKRPGMSKSALVEAALAQFLDAQDDGRDPIDDRLSVMSRQLEELDRGLRIVNETVALQARFHLAVTPVVAREDQGAACRLGAERFAELASQVRRRVQRGTSLMQEAMDSHDMTKPAPLAEEIHDEASAYEPGTQEQALSVPGLVEDESCLRVAVREGGSHLRFPGKLGIPLQ